MTYQIPAHLYDGAMHSVPVEVGDDFTSKWTALRDDGFTVAIAEGEILACKIMEGEPLPPMRS